MRYFIQIHKKIIAIITICIIACLVLALTLFYNIPRVKYELNENNVYYVKEAYGNASKYKIESTYKGIMVAVIDDNAFSGHTRLKTIEFASDSQIYSINRRAFADCKSLEKITIPSSVVYIGQNAFLNCTSLKEVEFNDDSLLEEIGGSAFFNCTSLSNIDLPSLLYSIGTFAFFNNKSLTQFTIPENVKMIYNEVFYGCEALKVIYDNSRYCQYHADWLLGTSDVIVMKRE